MGNNVIVLTTGLSGSSVVTSLISKAGYWKGDRTVKKNNATGNYDTYENSRLVELNTDLIESISFNYDNDAEYHSCAHLLFENAISRIEEKNTYMEFVEYCNSKGSWIWKDPRLWITIGYWQHIIDKPKTKIIILYRNPLSLWVSHITKRQIVEYGYLRNAEKNAREEMAKYIQSIGIDYHVICYDDLVMSPTKVLAEINEFLNVSLSLNDLKNAYNGKIGSKTWSLNRFIASILIYIKNFQHRKKD